MGIQVAPRISFDTLIFIRLPPELIRCPNNIVQYIILYVSTISRLLVVSVITSRLRAIFGTIYHINSYYNHHRMLSVRTLRFENYVDMTETPLRTITNRGTWMLILVPTYSTKIFIGQKHNNIRCSLCHRYVTCPRFVRRYLNT